MRIWGSYSRNRRGGDKPDTVVPSNDDFESAEYNQNVHTRRHAALDGNAKKKKKKDKKK